MCRNTTVTQTETETDQTDLYRALVWPDTHRLDVHQQAPNRHTNMYYSMLTHVHNLTSPPSTQT